MSLVRNPKPFQLQDDPRNAVVVLYEAVRELTSAVRELQENFLVVRAVAPSRPREGQYAYADGDNWDPGSGAGLYQYLAGTWGKL